MGRPTPFIFPMKTESLSDEIRTIRFGFPDKERQDAIEELAVKVRVKEEELSTLRQHADSQHDQIAAQAREITKLAKERGNHEASLRYIASALSDLDYGAAPVEELARRAAQAIRERDTLRAENARLQGELQSIADGSNTSWLADRARAALAPTEQPASQEKGAQG